MESRNKFNENIENKSQKDDNEKENIRNKIDEDQNEVFLNVENNYEDKIKKDKNEEEKIEDKKDEQDNDKIKNNNNIIDKNNKKTEENKAIYNISDFDYNEVKQLTNNNDKEKNNDNKLNENNDNKLNENDDKKLKENEDNKLKENNDNKLNENNDNKLNENEDHELKENEDKKINENNDNKLNEKNDNKTNENNDNKINENEEEITTSKKKENKIELNKNSISTIPIPHYELNINHILKYIKSHFNSYSSLFKLEYFINICLSYENLSKTNKINFYNQLLKIKYYQKEKNGILMLCQFFYKLYKNNDKYTIRILIRCFYRIAKYLNNDKYFPLSYQFSKIAENLIEKVKYKKYDGPIKKLLEKNEIFFENYYVNLKNKFTNISNDKLNELTQIFSNIENEMNNTINENNIYIISKIWFIYANHFLKIFIEKKNKQEDLNSFIEKSIKGGFLIEFENLKSNPIEGQLKEIAIFPGLINNFNLINFKDFWKENYDEENYVLKKDLELNKDYILINENNWNIL